MSRPRDVDVCTLDISSAEKVAGSCWPGSLCLLLLMAVLASADACAQTNGVAAGTDAQQMASIERRLNDLTATLTQTQEALRQSLSEIQRLRSELDGMRSQSAIASKSEMAVPMNHGTAALSGAETDSESSSSLHHDLQALQEQQDVLQSEIKQHEQIKLETDSKYSLRVTGVALFNAFSNAGVVDNAELPGLALPRVAGASHGSNGATLRQTVFGVAANGPVIAGAHSSAAINVDFFGGTATNNFGYSAPSGSLRMRDGEVALVWDKSTIEAGYTTPLISPLSPTSYATLAQPSLSGSGNLWIWSPQVRFEQRIPLGEDRGLSLEAGLIYPASFTYQAIQFDSPVEASRRPGVEGRLAYHSDRAATASPHSLVVGVGAYKASQFYSSKTHIGSWAVTGDWRIPLTRRFDLSGEIYRGQALGGFGGGLYKDVNIGTDYATGLGRTVGVNTAGGWSQLKFNFSSRIEANAAFGLDDAFASSFDSLILSSTSSPVALAARNDSVVGNVIFRPRASLILSPEYRHILSWSYTGAPNVANLFTLSAGYQF
jgi:hypothetical protein